MTFRVVESGRLSSCAGVRVASLLLGILAAASPAALRAQDTTATMGVYVRDDSDRTTVVTPRVQVATQVSEDTRVGAVYTVDVWSSASIDIRTAATPRVTEQRDELNLTLEQALGDSMTLGASYRYSTEVDYESHGGSLGLSIDLADNAANLAVTGRIYLDQVGRAGDPAFGWRDASTVVGRVAYTQVLDPKTFIQAIYELTRQEGFLSSPYRMVRLLGFDATQPAYICQWPVEGGVCLMERNPDSRLRHAGAVTLRRALTESLSVGGGYRFYLDDWGMLANTASVDGTLLLDEAWLFSLGYRFYHQGKADHYEPNYSRASPPRYRTSDKELSTLMSHRLDVSVSRTFEVDALGGDLRAILLAAPSYFTYDDFPLLDSIQAIEVTLAVEAQL